MDKFDIIQINQYLKKNKKLYILFIYYINLLF